ncbi:hypothetical protein [Vibrio genomosp. F10]|uniref:Lipoprotein n=1 Tax=Vibrio genomosp. F10 TaxID=723171 RepID=A0A1B9QVF3_9VIBR|nr:hypothetical protein [Vibrio genomosp. F10]OCH72896.1 hypothetical protein A6E14_15200 [Vibrio genomosp. F10]
MKNLMTLSIVAFALSGCDDATKAIDQAQQAANQAVDSIQSQIDSIDFDQLNLEQFGETAELAEELASSIGEALSADFANPEELTQISDHVANAYSCLVEASSESTAEKVLDKILSSITGEEAMSLIDKGIARAKAAQECVM